MSSSETNNGPLVAANLPDTARSDDDATIVESFEIRALEASCFHKRIAGYWDIEWLRQAQNGLLKYTDSGHKMQLLIGIPINRSMKPVLAAYQESFGDGIGTGRLLVQLMEENPKLASSEHFALLKEMMSNHLIEIRVHLVNEPKKVPRPEHAKVQIYYDNNQNVVGSSGSKNDSTRGNRGGVDFITITKSWTSEEAHNQITGMTKYFEDHWDLDNEHTHSLDDFLDNPELLELLENLADKEGKSIRPLTQLARLIGSIPDNIERLIVINRGMKNPVEYISNRDEVHTISQPSGIENSNFFALIREYLPDQMNRTLFVCDEELEEQLPKGEDIAHISSNTDDSWNFNHLEEDEDNLSSDEIHEIILNFFNLEPEDEPEPEPNSENTVEDVRNPTHELVPELIVQYPYGTDLRPHHIRSLTGQPPADVTGETHIEGGFLNTRCGLFEHATGSGKTGLGLITAAHMMQDPEIDFVVVVAPRIRIADQWWSDAVEWFNYPKRKFVPWRSYSNSNVLQDSSMHKKSKLEPDDWPIMLDSRDIEKSSLLITVSNTFFDNIQRLVECQEMGLKWGLIVDEAHNLVTNDGSKIDLLNELNPEYRLALTAKFAHPKNSTSSVAVLDWFTADDNNNIDKFPLSSALKEGYLKPYQYILHEIDCKENDPESVDKLAQDYVVENINQLLHGPTLLYANVSKVAELNELKERITGEKLYPETFTYNHQSPILLDRWAKGVFNPMMALKILDEGVNVPECSAAILLDCSEYDDREWIQRRGRTLRVGSYEQAFIHDFAPAFNLKSEWVVQWWRDNGNRLREFASDALSSRVILSQDSLVINSKEPSITQRVIEILSEVGE